jgi:hypothetical protein
VIRTPSPAHTTPPGYFFDLDGGRFRDVAVVADPIADVRSQRGRGRPWDCRCREGSPRSWGLTLNAVSADSAGTVATWSWQATDDIPETTARGLREVCVAVPLAGVDDHVAALTSALRANGIAVSCLCGDPMWAVDHDTALNWAFRATTDAVFDGVHLDVEPWTLPGRRGGWRTTITTW